MSQLVIELSKWNGKGECCYSFFFSSSAGGSNTDLSFKDVIWQMDGSRNMKGRGNEDRKNIVYYYTVAGEVERERRQQDRWRLSPEKKSLIPPNMRA